MAKFRKRPITVEAVQFRYGESPAGICRCPLGPGGACDPHIHTIHQGQTVLLTDGDWIITEPDGEHFYPCKPEIFFATYEEVRSGD